MRKRSALPLTLFPWCKQHWPEEQVLSLCSAGQCQKMCRVLVETGCTVATAHCCCCCGSPIWCIGAVLLWTGRERSSAETEAGVGICLSSLTNEVSLWLLRCLTVRLWGSRLRPTHSFTQRLPLQGFGWTEKKQESHDLPHSWDNLSS